MYDLIADPSKRAIVKAYVDQYMIDNQAAMDPVPVHRKYNPTIGDHFYTIAQTEGPATWNYENVEFKAYSFDVPGTVPIYRFYNGHDHYYSTSPFVPTGYTAEGIRFYAFSTQIPGTIAIRRYYNSKSGDHFYTTSTTTPTGYQYEQVAFYAFAP